MATQRGITDDVLFQLASDIETSEMMEALGHTLGFSAAAINRFTATNYRGDRVTFKGTRNMLFDWRQTVAPCEQHLKLKKALTDAGLHMLADTHLHVTPNIPGPMDITGRTEEMESDSPSRSTPLPQKEFYDIYLLSASSDTPYFIEMENLIERNGWKMTTRFESKLGEPEMKSMVEVVKNSSHVVCLITEQDDEKDDVNTMTIETAFQTLTDKGLGGRVIPVFCCDKSLAPTLLKALTGANIHDNLFERRLRKSIDVNIRKERENRYRSVQHPTNTQPASAVQVLSSLSSMREEGQGEVQHPANTPPASVVQVPSSLSSEREEGQGEVQHPTNTPPALVVQVPSSPSFRREQGLGEVEHDGRGYYTQPMKQAKPSKEQLDPKKNYKMDVLRKGRIFISNMTRRREGSKVDVANIKHVFKEIGFEIEPHSDLTAEGLIYELEKFVNSPCHEGMCSSVFLFMGHGSKTGIQCHDEEMVSTEFIRDKVSGMKYMNGKPKLIFFQSCRGGVDVERVERDQRETDMTIPAKSDVLMVHATTDGDAAYRSPVLGSWFIQMLCEELLKNAHDSDLSTMLDQVTGKVGNMTFTENLTSYGQCPVVVKQGISKKIYFLPKYPQQRLNSPAE